MAFWLPHSVRSLLSNHPKLKERCTAFASTVLTGSLLVAATVVVAREIGAIKGFELGAYDSLMRLRPDEGPDNRVVVVGISEQDIQSRKEYPLQDRTLAQLLDTLEQYEPRAIGVDIARDVPQGELNDAEWKELSQKLEQLLRDTRRFMDQGAGRDNLTRQIDGLEAIITRETGRAAMTKKFAEGDSIIAACKLNEADDPGLPPAPGTPPDRVGFADFAQDPKGVIRRGILLAVPGETTVPITNPHLCNDPSPENLLISMDLAMAIRYLEPEGIVPTQTEDGEIQIGQAVFKRLGSQVVGYNDTGASDYQIMINYRSAQRPARIISLSDVLAKNVEADWIKDKIVVVGYTSELARDIFVTPYSGANSSASNGQSLMPGAVIHAQIVSQIVSAALGERSLIWYWPRGVEIAWIVGWSIVGGSVAWFVRRFWMYALSLGISFGVLYGICYGLFVVSGWIPLVPPAIALFGSAIGVALFDRANKSGYTQAIYEQVREQVKVVLKPKIEIDEEKRARQVAEITESGYFQDLVARAKTIREQRAQQEK
ncbi:MAG TPA: CHASE2 domain-containing protein [Chroococcidiopsis sp.]